MSTKNDHGPGPSDGTALARRSQRGIALMAVMFFVLLAVTGVATFLRRATVDGLVARNRDLSAQAEALARGGVQLATALLLQDKIDESDGALPRETLNDRWAQISSASIDTADGGQLRLKIEDSGARLNLNALLADGELRHEQRSEAFLAELLDRVIDEIPGGDENRNFDSAELARDLLDYMDKDDVGIFGGLEDDYYLEQDPPYRAANRPILSIDELALVKGFDRALVEALRPYVSVYPLHSGDGVNPNTAPSWVLALMFHGVGNERFATEDTVRRVREMRENGTTFCEDAIGQECTAIGQTVDGEIFPPPTFETDVFRVESIARYGDVERTVIAWIDRSEPEEPRWLAWDLR